MKPHDNPETKKKCDCGPECTCGCNEGKECHCGSGCNCGCRCKSCGGKIIALLIVFLAGMGFNELLHGCFGRCKCPCMRHSATMPAPHRPMAYSDNAGTVVIVNAGGGAEVFHGMKHGMKHGPKHDMKHGMEHNTKHGDKSNFDKMKKHHHKNHQDKPAQPPASTEIEGRTIKIK